MMKASELVGKAIDIAKNDKTLYVICLLYTSDAADEL